MMKAKYEHHDIHLRGQKSNFRASDRFAGAMDSSCSCVQNQDLIAFEEPRTSSSSRTRTMMKTIARRRARRVFHSLIFASDRPNLELVLDPSVKVLLTPES
jgi:hypothetical protein